MKIILYLLLLNVLLFSQSRIYNYPTYISYKSTNITQKKFYVQIGAFKDKRYAIKIERTLKRVSYPTHIIKRLIDTTYYYKLLVGAYQSRQEAQLVKNELNKYYEGAFILWDI